MPQLVLLRHGESQFNKESRFCGWVNVSLSDKGTQQAIYCGELLKNNELTKNIPFHLLITSRLKRAVLTSNIILEIIDRLDIDVVKSWRLNERYDGILQGLKKNDVLVKYGYDQFMYWRRNFRGRPPEMIPTNKYYKDTLKVAQFDNELAEQSKLVPKAESLEMVIERLAPFWEKIVDGTLSKNKNVLCVTHGSIVRALLKIIYKLTENEVENLNIPNGMPILVDFEIDEKGSLKPVGEKWIYLEPEKAAVEAEKVKNDGQQCV